MPSMSKPYNFIGRNMKTPLRALLTLMLVNLFCLPVWADSDEQLIQQTLTNYIQGTSYNKPQQIEKAFYKEANLLLEKKGAPVWRVPAKEYISWFSKGVKGKFNGRVGEIMNIDVSGKVATAKVEIIIPTAQHRYVDLFLLKKLDNQWKIISKTAASESATHNAKRILFIVSNTHFYGNLDKPAGASFSEIVNAYHIFKEAGYTVDFVSPKGGAIPLAYINTSDDLHKKHLYNTDFMYALAHTKQPKDIRPENYKAVHYIGGSSAMFGVANNKELHKISMEIYEKHNGIISAVCHGTAGIVDLKTSDGKYLVSGKRISGYPDEYENKSAPYFKQFPFLITETIEQRKGIFKYSARNKAHVEVDGRIITGQNYLSSALVAQKIIEKIETGS
jgi:putative intracellular protease/amidase